MEKQGFTLIELLAVVTIIALLASLVLPNILGNVDKKKGEISEANMRLLTSAADIYIENNRSRYAHSFDSNGSTYCIAVQSLINDGILESPFVDVDGVPIDYSRIVKSTYNDTYNSFDYELVDVGDCTEIVNYVNRPVLDDNMIPVVYDNGKWLKADVNSKWYNYKDKNWANAVYVRELKDNSVSSSKSRYEYKDALPGTEVVESDILAFFVWIPRFRYQLFTNESQTINIAFESTSTQKSNGIAKGQWLTHPAFTVSDMELPGIWVAKYEASNNDGNVIIKSNMSPWTGRDYNSVNQLSYDMCSADNIYGMSKNSHLIKNSEWSAVAFLSQSVYGVNGRINTTSSLTTGNTNSTTGNYTGVFDMSGLSGEFVNTSLEREEDSGFALLETSNWYGDSNTFTTDEEQYLVRGNSSIFNYTRSQINNSSASFRVALTDTSLKPDYYKPYYITLDANGGDVDYTTKMVTYNSLYGDLPIPTREGYTFMGWQGKNLLGLSGRTEFKNYVTGDLYPETAREFSGAYIYTGISASNWWNIPNASFSNIDGVNNSVTVTTNGGGYGVAFDVKVKPNTRYTVSVKNLEENMDLYLSDFDEEGFNLEYAKRMSGRDGLKSTSYTTQNETAWFFVILASQLQCTYTQSNIQLEVGDRATSYEPYRIINKDSLVMSIESHTLTALWQEN